MTIINKMFTSQNIFSNSDTNNNKYTIFIPQLVMCGK